MATRCAPTIEMSVSDATARPSTRSSGVGSSGRRITPYGSPRYGHGEAAALGRRESLEGSLLAHPPQSLRLDLADALAGDAELVRDFLKRKRLLSGQEA